ncbi:MAG: DNA replication complex GINS family protein [Methanophagales archaeon]|nr:DNA replication complex GINS family protein [Methanophagales archaeon]
MDIEKLWEILYKERNTASLQELPETFCEEVSEYMGKLAEEKEEEDERRRELIEDEIRNARMKVEDIIRRRIGKIVKLASSGMKTAPKGMLEEEQMIFEGVKSHVVEGREKIFALILSEKEGKSEKRDAEKKNEASSPAPVPAKSNTEELHIVRILEDIPTFMGTDGRIYKVRKEDVIMLPKTNAEILCKRGVAVRFEGEKRREEEVSKGGIEK